MSPRSLVSGTRGGGISKVVETRDGETGDGAEGMNEGGFRMVSCIQRIRRRVSEWQSAILNERKTTKNKRSK